MLDGFAGTQGQGTVSVVNVTIAIAIACSDGLSLSPVVVPTDYRYRVDTIAIVSGAAAAGWSNSGPKTQVSPGRGAVADRGAAARPTGSTCGACLIGGAGGLYSARPCYFSIRVLRPHQATTHLANCTRRPRFTFAHIRSSRVLSFIPAVRLSRMRPAKLKNLSTVAEEAGHAKY